MTEGSSGTLLTLPQSPFRSRHHGIATDCVTNERRISLLSNNENTAGRAINPLQNFSAGGLINKGRDAVIETVNLHLRCAGKEARGSSLGRPGNSPKGRDSRLELPRKDGDGGIK